MKKYGDKRNENYLGNRISVTWGQCQQVKISKLGVYCPQGSFNFIIKIIDNQSNMLNKGVK